MKHLSLFSRVATTFCLMYIIFQIVCSVCLATDVSLPVVLGSIFSICFYILYIVFSVLLAMHDGAFKRAALWVIVAVVLELVVLNCRFASSFWIQSFVPIAHLLYMILFCVGFCKLFSSFPKRTLARYMSIVVFSMIPLNFVVSSYGWAPAVDVLLLNKILFLVQLVATALLYYSLPKSLK